MNSVTVLLANLLTISFATAFPLHMLLPAIAPTGKRLARTDPGKLTGAVRKPLGFVCHADRQPFEVRKSNVAKRRHRLHNLPS